MDGTLIWAATCSREDRLELFKSLCDCIKENEVKPAKNILTNAIKKKKRLESSSNERIAPVPDTFVSAPASTPSAPGPPVPECPPAPQQDIPWWKNGYKPSDFVSIDCEMVSLHAKDPVTGKRIVRAATVVIIDFKKRILYQARIKHCPGTFIVNNHTIKVNGFRSNSLKDGEDFLQVSRHVASLLEEKVVVGSGCEADFRSLGLVISNFNVFNIGDHWKKWTGQTTKLGMKVYQEIGLRSLYFHYFNKDLHTGEHSAEIDARATMELFHLYMKIKTSNLASRFHDYDEFDCIKILKN